MWTANLAKKWSWATRVDVILHEKRKRYMQCTDPWVSQRTSEKKKTHERKIDRRPVRMKVDDLEWPIRAREERN